MSHGEKGREVEEEGGRKGLCYVLHCVVRYLLCIRLKGRGISSGLA